MKKLKKMAKSICATYAPPCISRSPPSSHEGSFIFEFGANFPPFEAIWRAASKQKHFFKIATKREALVESAYFTCGLDQ